MGSEDDRETRILLVGMTGAGKSATGNTLTGKEDAFESSVDLGSVTATCSFSTANRFGRKLVVIDTPGFCDTEKSDEEVTAEIFRGSALASPGFHAFIFVIQPGRLTDDAKRSINLYFKTFGTDLAKYTIILFTHFDKLKKKYGTAEKYVDSCKGQKGLSMLNTMVELCKGRVIGFNNDADEPEKSDQVERLIMKIDAMVSSAGGKPFPHADFLAMEVCIQKEIVQGNTWDKIRSFHEKVWKSVADTSPPFTKDEKTASVVIRKEEKEEPTSKDDKDEEHDVLRSSDCSEDILQEANNILKAEGKTFDRDEVRQKIQKQSVNRKSFFYRVVNELKEVFRKQSTDVVVIS